MLLELQSRTRGGRLVLVLFFALEYTARACWLFFAVCVVMSKVTVVKFYCIACVLV